MFESLLAVDIGNSKIKACTFTGTSDASKFISCNELAEISNSFSGYNFDLIALASVVPFLTNDFINIFSDKNKLFIIDKTKLFNITFRNNYFDFIGIDRLCSLEGAFALYKQRNGLSDLCLVIDCGTATTMSLINKSGIYLGGLISPGIATMFKSLNANTAQLPYIENANYESFLGNSTLGNITSGVFNSAIGLVYFTLEQIKSNYPDQNIDIYITGGNAAGLLKFFNFNFFYEPSLVLQGIKQIALLNYK